MKCPKCQGEIVSKILAKDLSYLECLDCGKVLSKVVDRSTKEEKG